jgi:hypothetical protein
MKSPGAFYAIGLWLLHPFLPLKHYQCLVHKVAASVVEAATLDLKS